MYRSAAQSCCRLLALVLWYDPVCGSDLATLCDPWYTDSCTRIIIQSLTDLAIMSTMVTTNCYRHTSM